MEGGSDLGQGGQDEAAFVHGGVGQDEFGGVEDFFVVEEKIEVDEARAFGGSGGAVATHRVFDCEQCVEEIDGGERCFEERGGVEEAGLVEVADGVGVVEGGDGGDVAEGFEMVQGFAEIGFAVAEVGA